MRILISIMLSWTVLFSLIAQNKYYLEPLKNAISIELESFIFFGDATINYERNLISGKNNSFLLNIRSGFGKYYVAHFQGTDNGGVISQMRRELNRKKAELRKVGRTIGYMKKINTKTDKCYIY